MAWPSPAGCTSGCSRTPAIRDLFNQSHHGETGSQPKALAAAVLAYAKNIDNLGVLTAAVERIAQKHVGLNILPEHYPAVADALLGAIGDVLGEAATPAIMAAWGEAYWFLADMLIGREKQIYGNTPRHPAAGPAGATSSWRRRRGRARSSPPSPSSRRMAARCCGTARAST